MAVEGWWPAASLGWLTKPHVDNRDSSPDDKENRYKHKWKESKARSWNGMELKTAE